MMDNDSILSAISLLDALLEATGAADVSMKRYMDDGGRFVERTVFRFYDIKAMKWRACTIEDTAVEDAAFPAFDFITQPIKRRIAEGVVE